MSFSDGLIHRCAVEVKGEPVKGARGGDATAYEPVPGLQSVACRLTTPTGRERDAYGRRGMEITHKVLLPTRTRLTNLHRLVFIDPVTQLPAYLIVHAAYDPFLSGGGYVAICKEFST